MPGCCHRRAEERHHWPAQTRRVEQQQQITVNWLNPGDQTIIETTIGYAQVAIDLTAYLARSEPDPYVREAFNLGLLEDFDHLYRYSELLGYLEGTDPNTVGQGKTDHDPEAPGAGHADARRDAERPEHG